METAITVVAVELLLSRIAMIPFFFRRGVLQVRGCISGYRLHAASLVIYRPRDVTANQIG